MKKIIFVLIFLISSYTFGQSFPPKEYKHFDFSKIEAKVSDTEKLALLKKRAYSKYVNLYTPAISKDGEFSNYHVLDFNGDGLLDIIYNNKEADGIEKTIAAFYVNEKDSLRPVIKLLGNFTKINIENNQLKSFQLIQFPCCAQYEYLLEDYEFKNSTDCFIPYRNKKNKYISGYEKLNSSEFCVSLTDRYGYVMQTEFPDNSTIKDTLKVTKNVYLTIKPSKTTDADFNRDDYAYFYEGNKAISYLSVGTSCYVIAERKDENDELFCFVMLINNDKYNNLMSYDFYQYGWVQKSNLK
ncbi:hypothetical protein [Kordia jejudonensis]|uniref:hypothetical protein n=1 Tax=Kordia jejudonensis TaxID=1348245 RepID=UPI0006298938|nr:hypothetical protein [Kordia jejudonensis]